MTPHQSFTDLCVLAIAYGASKVSASLAQTIVPDNWTALITGPMSGIFIMAVCIWYLAKRNAAQDAINRAEKAKAEEKAEARQREADERAEKEHSARIETIEKLSQTLAQNSVVITHCSAVLEQHTCVKPNK
jgi:hypothetical protein